MSTAAAKRYTVAEYLAFERASETKHEFYDGEIFAMAGASESHNLIVGNCIRTIGNALSDGPCRVYPSDLRVLCPSGLRTYPNVSVVCGEPQFEDERRDTLTNPVVIIEVLSPSTETYDRGNKFENYQAIPTLREYVLVRQDRIRVEHYSRPEGADEWGFKARDDPGTVLSIPGINCEVSLHDVYAKVEFPPGKLALHDDFGNTSTSTDGEQTAT